MKTEILVFQSPVGNSYTAELLIYDDGTCQVIYPNRHHFCWLARGEIAAFVREIRKRLVDWVVGRSTANPEN